MVQELERLRTKTPFPETAPAAYPVFYRTYSRRLDNGQRESWYDVCDRTLTGLVELGKLTNDEKTLVQRMQRELKALPSGRWLWVGGTEWSKQPKNFSGAYNCTSTNVVDWRAFGLMMDLAMMGCGTGAILEPKYIDRLPVIRNRLSVTMVGAVGATPADRRREPDQSDARFKCRRRQPGLEPGRRTDRVCLHTRGRRHLRHGSDRREPTPGQRRRLQPFMVARRDEARVRDRRSAHALQPLLPRPAQSRRYRIP